MEQSHNLHSKAHIFTGNIFVFHAFDIGEDINLEHIHTNDDIHIKPFAPSKYFKNYHVPLALEVMSAENMNKCISSKIHNFGVISLAYKIPFEDSLENLRKKINVIDTEYEESSVKDAKHIFNLIKAQVKQPSFFHLRTCYVVIQVDPQPNSIGVVELKDKYGGVIGALLRFETENLSEYQKNEILDDAMGYYRGDLFIVDIEAAFVYDEEYEDILDIFEFANIQQLELQYFDRVLDQQLNVVYQRQVRYVPFKAYMPLFSSLSHDQVSSLSILKVDISVIIERLESSIKLAGEAYISELYRLLVEKLDLHNWKESIDSKLEIIQDINTVYQNKTDSLREDVLSVLISVLIFIELIIGILNYIK